MFNKARVIQDISNQGPRGVGGGELTQLNLKRVSGEGAGFVPAFVEAVTTCLMGGASPGPRSPFEAKAWAEAATFFSGRIQGSSGECPGRNADMSRPEAAAMKKVIAKIEAASLLVGNRETVVKDICNGGTTGVKGGELTQPNLKRSSPEYQGLVDGMIGEVIGRLLGNQSAVTAPGGFLGLGKTAKFATTNQDAKVWSEAATFFSGRIQASAAECNGRAPDMSPAAAGELRKMLASLEAATLLKTNKDRIVADITNPGPRAVGGGSITQMGLKRLSPADAPAVDRFVSAVSSKLLGNERFGPSGEDARVWSEAASFFSKRIQVSAGECPGRNADMSPNAATMMRQVIMEVSR